MRKQAKNYLEDSESQALFKAAEMVPILRDYLTHYPGGGFRKIREAGRFKKMGVRAGVSDYFLPVARGAYHSLWVELKAMPLPGGKKTMPTKEQYEWRDLMLAEGNAAYIVRGWENVLQILLDYLALEPGQVLIVDDKHIL